MSLKTLGIIPARGGSKGVPKKNIAMLLGNPLLAYTAEAAFNSRRLSKVVLSTEDPEIASIGKDLGLDVPCMRPAELALDSTPTLPVLQHMVRHLEKKGEAFDAVMILQPTNPLRTPEDIDGSILLLENSQADSVISFVDVGEKHPARMKFIDEAGRITDPPFKETSEGQRRQDLPKMYLREGSIYLTRTDVLMKEDSIQGDDCRAWIVSPERACNIDTPFDLFLCEHLLKYLSTHKNQKSNGHQSKDQPE